MKEKIYKDGEYAPEKECFKCKTKGGVFYDKKFDVFTHSECLHEFEESFDKKCKNQE